MMEIEEWWQSKIYFIKCVMNQLDPIEELYNMYSKEENTPRIIEIEDDRLGLNLDIKDGLADLYLEL